MLWNAQYNAETLTMTTTIAARNSEKSIVLAVPSPGRGGGVGAEVGVSLPGGRNSSKRRANKPNIKTVSYTHLTLTTILHV